MQEVKHLRWLKRTGNQLCILQSAGRERESDSKGEKENCPPWCPSDIEDSTLPAVPCVG